MACQEPMLRSNQVLKQEEAQDLGFEGQDVAQYVKQQQKLDREEHEEGAVWRDVQKRQAENYAKVIHTDNQIVSPKSVPRIRTV